MGYERNHSFHAYYVDFNDYLHDIVSNIQVLDGFRNFFMDRNCQSQGSTLIVEESVFLR